MIETIRKMRNEKQENNVTHSENVKRKRRKGRRKVLKATIIGAIRICENMLDLEPQHIGNCRSSEGKCTVLDFWWYITACMVKGCRMY